MENFIGKVIKIVSGDKGASKDYWIDDSKCKACYECESAFSQWNRHQCRICGRVFCGNCTRNSIPPPRESADQQWLRVCNYCYRVRQRSDQPVVRVHHQHAGSRGPGASTLSQPGSLRQQPDTGFQAGISSSDASTSSVAGGRTRNGASSRWSRQSSVHRVTGGDLSWTLPPPLENDFGMSLVDRDARLLHQQQLEAGALPPDAPPQANSLGEVHRQLFCRAADTHLRAVVQQLLMAESVPQPEVWAPIVSGAAQAVAAYLSPTQMYANGQHDPRQSLKMKKVADVGRPEDTCVVTGVVVRKGLVHRKMRAYIEYPKVLLLQGSLEYQRETNKLSSFDLMDHDKQYLANAVARLSVLKPDVVLVEGSVARMAQEDLLARNISVAQKIKSKVLERLARAMGVRVAPTVEHLSAQSAHLYLGDCKVFRVEAETINVKAGAPEPPSPLPPAVALAPTASAAAACEPAAAAGTAGRGSVMTCAEATTGTAAVELGAGSRTHSRSPSGHGTGHSRTPSGQAAGQAATHSRTPSGQGATHSRTPSGQGATHSRTPSGQGPTHSRTPSGQGATHSRTPSGQGATHSRTPSGQGATHSRNPSGQGPTHSRNPSGQGPTHSRTPSGQGVTHSRTPSGQGLGPEVPPPSAAMAPAALGQAPMEPGQQAAATDQHTTAEPDEQAPASADGSEGVVSQPVPRPAIDDQQARYTSLSAAMMMKALGSGPNAAAAVALVSAGSGVVVPSVMPFRSWASPAQAPAVTSASAPEPGPPASEGGQGGPSTSAAAAAAAAAADSRSTALAATPAADTPLPPLGRTAPPPVPAGPPAPPQVTLMYFEGCRPITSTVLIKGAGLELLRKLKPVVGFAVLTAWNQRLESAYLADLLTAAAASAGEEAYTTWAGATTGTSASTRTSINPGVSTSLPAGAAQPLAMPTPLHSAPPLSLGFFRQHAEQAVRASVVAASASGVPGILLSISPHCNAWDESLIAEWEQQGFTFPHLQPDYHHNHHYGYAHGNAIGQGHQPPRVLEAQSKPPPQQQQQQPQEAEADEAKAAGKATGQAGEGGMPAAVAEAAVGHADAVVGAEQGLQEELSLVVPNVTKAAGGEQAAVSAEGDGSTEGRAAQAAAAAADAAVASDAAHWSMPPDFVPTSSAATLMSPFMAAAALAVAVNDMAAVQRGPEPLQGRDAGLALEAPAARSCADGPAGQRDALAATLGESGDGGAGAKAAAEVLMPPSDLAGTAAAGSGTAAVAARSEASTQPQQEQQTAAGAMQQGKEEQQQQQPQQQSAVMVLQGQRIYSHQRIFVTCMFRRSRDRNLCDPFQVKQIDYYHRSSDVPLIRYIRMCTLPGWTCPGPGCPEPFTAHESVFFFGCRKLTIFYFMLPPIQALPGEERNQIWHWTRPIGRGREGAASCRRLPLSQDACYLSMGRFLELSFSSDGLDIFGRSLHYDHVRYFGLGRTLVCMFPERTSVYVMQLPDVVMSYTHQAQMKWLRQEGAELAQEAGDAFDLIDLMLGESPHFSGGGVATAATAAAVGSGEWDAPAQQGPAACSGDSAAGDAIAAAATGITPGSSPGAAPSSVAAGPASPVLTPLLVAVRKDRQSFLALLADCLARCAPQAPPSPPSPPSHSSFSVPWDELVISVVRELNWLRSVLAKAVLQWASRLQDPAGFMAHYNRVTSGGGGAGRPILRGQRQLQPQTQAPPMQAPQPQSQPQSILPSSPCASLPLPIPVATVGWGSDTITAAAAFASTTQMPPSQLSQPAAQDAPSFTFSEGPMSVSTAAAAYRMGLLPGQVGMAMPTSENASFTSVSVSELAADPMHQQLPHAVDTTAAHALPIPIVPHSTGPLSVHAVAEMVAQQELRGGGELLEGSRALLGAAGGHAAAAAVTMQPAAACPPGHSRGHSCGASDLPPGSAALIATAATGTSSSLGVTAEAVVAASAPPGPPSQCGGAVTGTPGRSAAQPSGSNFAAAGASTMRLSAQGRLSSGGGAVTHALDAAAAGAGLVGLTHAAASGGGARATSLPRSASVSTIGDMGDLSYMAGISGDSGDDEDNDGGEEGREDADDEDPDHDTFLAFMGSAPRSGPAFQAGAGGRGSDSTASGNRLATASGNGTACGDSGDDVADEVADGAYYYRALFSHGLGGEGGAGNAPPQPLLPAEPIQLQKAQQHPLQPRDRGEQEQAQPRLLDGASNGQSCAPVLQSSLPPSTVAALPSGVAAGSAAQSPHSPTLGVAPRLSGGPMPLVPAVDPFSAVASGVPDVTVAAAVATTFSRRQLMVNVRRRLESVAVATAVGGGGGMLTRGFIPLPGRATLLPGVNDIIIPIFDGEPTSIIAYALSTRAYQQQINAGYKAIFGRARAEINRDRERDREPAAAVQPMTTLGMSEQQQQQQQGAPVLGAQGGLQSTTANATVSAAGIVAGAVGPSQGAVPAAGCASAGSGAVPAPVPGQPANVMYPSAAVAAAASGPGAGQATTSAGGCLPPQQAPPPQHAPLPLPAGPLGASPDAEWWTVLTSKEACHVRVAFEDEARSMPWARARFTVMAHFAPQFAELRRRCIQGGEAAFVASMCRCKRWESRGGKSNAYFAKTRDDRYIIKSLSKSEKASFMNFAPHYFAHMGRHLLNRESPTCLAKILGVYSVTFKPQPGTVGLEGTGGGGPAAMAASAALVKELKDREFSQELLVMENCFYDRPVARIYDLKGSERNRFNADAASRPEDHLEVHLDDNLRRTMHTNPIFVDARSRHQMEAAVWADTGFLAGQDVMDYSLLVGVDKENGVLALAIIDFIRQYTWDKQLETWVKSSAMLGGNGKEPTIISPKQYMRRFRAAMQQYFTAVPGSTGSEVPKDPDAAA